MTQLSTGRLLGAGLGFIQMAGTCAAEVRFQRVEVDAQPPSNPWVKLAGDFNQDGRLDIAIAGQKGPLVWYVNHGGADQPVELWLNQGNSTATPKASR